jgi:cystathionine beta-lyase/cystathionine gamma-synthase
MRSRSRIGPSLGGVESLVEQPALMSYFELSSAEREAIGMSDDLVRYAVGIETQRPLRSAARPRRVLVARRSTCRRG